MMGTYLGLPIHDALANTPAIGPILAGIIHEETGMGAVAITDTERVLAFVGTGSDHHQPGSHISSSLTRQAIAENIEELRCVL